MANSNVPPVVQAAVVSFGFVYHRLLIHDVLTRAGLVPAGIVLLVSAVI